MDDLDRALETLDETHGYEVALAFVGAFSALQFTIDFHVDLYLRAHVGEFGAVMSRIYVQDRLSDSARVALCLALAEDADYSGNLTVFRSTYETARRARNFLAHGRVDWPMRTDRGSEVLAMKVAQRKGVVEQESFLPSELVQFIRDCSWLGDHVSRIVYETGRVKFNTYDGTRRLIDFEPPLPPPRPPRR